MIQSNHSTAKFKCSVSTCLSRSLSAFKKKKETSKALSGCHQVNSIVPISPKISSPTCYYYFLHFKHFSPATRSNYLVRVGREETAESAGRQPVGRRRCRLPITVPSAIQLENNTRKNETNVVHSIEQKFNCSIFDLEIFSTP